MRRSGFALAVVFSLLCAAGCGGEPKNGEPSDAPAGSAAPSWMVRVGAQGGFTGGGSGHIVRSDGTVLSWSQLTPEESITQESLGRAEPKTLRELHRAMTDPALAAVEQSESGNLTAFLEWRLGDRSRRFSWTERLGEPVLPPPLQRAYLATLAAVRSAQR
jgi:hypothetical protein